MDKCTDENGRLKIVNEELRQQLVDNNIFPVRRMTSDGLESNGGSGGKVKSADNGDISTIIKLSNKLQEMVHVNENVTRVNAALRRVCFKPYYCLAVYCTLDCMGVKLSPT